MDYRDDRDAQRARADSLEAELTAARAEIERLRALEVTLAAAERDNAKLRAELRRLAPRPRGRAGLMIGFMAVTGLGICGAGVAFLLVSRPADPPAMPHAQPDPWTGASVVEGPAPAPEPAASPRAATVEWAAKVTRATGLPYPAGSPCVVRATVRSDGAKVLAPDVELSCGGAWLYRSSDQLEGMSSLSYSVEEAPGPDAGSYRAALGYEDQGTRTGQRAQVSVSSLDGVAVAWRDTAPSYRVELALDELSSSWKGPALFTAHETARADFREAVTRAGAAAQVQGTPLVAPGASCSVRVRPAFAGDQNCRISVRCGEAALYGAGGGGFAACTTEGGRVFGAKDGKPSTEDRDPAVDVSLPRGAVEVTDTSPGPWSVKIQLAP